MRKLTALLLAVFIIFGAAACAAPEQTPVNNQPAEQNQQEQEGSPEAAKPAETGPQGPGATEAKIGTQLERDCAAIADNELGNSGASISYAISQNSSIILENALGFADPLAKTPATPELAYGVGEISELYTALAIAQMLDDQNIKATDVVTKYLKDFKTASGDFNKITIEQLLNKTSGVNSPNLNNQYTFVSADEKYSATSVNSGESLSGTPGAYSVDTANHFALLQEIIASAGKQKYTDYVINNIIIPIEASNTNFLAVTQTNLNMAKMMTADGNILPQEVANSLGALGVAATAEDLCKLGNLYMNLGEDLITPDTVTKMITPQGKTFIEEDNSSATLGWGWDYANFPALGFSLEDSTILVKRGETQQYKSALIAIPFYNVSCAAVATSDFNGDMVTMLLSMVKSLLTINGVTLKEDALPVKEEKAKMPADFKTKFEGTYASGEGIYSVEVAGDSTVIINNITDSNNKIPVTNNLAYGKTGLIDDKGIVKYKFVSNDVGTFILESDMRAKDLYFHSFAQKLKAGTVEPGAWTDRVDKPYIISNFGAQGASMLLPRLTIKNADGVKGVLIAGVGRDSDFAVAPQMISTDSLAKKMLKLPDYAGSFLYDLYTKKIGAATYLSYAGNLYQKAEGLTDLASGSVTIPKDGINAVYKVSGTIKTKLPDGVRLVLLDTNFALVYDSAYMKDIPNVSGYAIFAGKAGDKIEVTL